MGWQPGSIMTFPTQAWIASGFVDWTVGIPQFSSYCQDCPEYFQDLMPNKVNIKKGMPEGSIVERCEDFIKTNDDIGPWTYCWGNTDSAMTFRFNRSSSATLFVMLDDD